MLLFLAYCCSRRAPHSRYNPAPACVGISPEQAQRLLDGECLPLHGSQLCQHIHPPPAIQSVDLVRQVEKDLEAVGRDISNKQNQSAVPAKSDAPRVGAAAAAAAETSRDGSMLGHKRGDAGKNQEGQPFKFTPLAINPADTLHLQMSPKVRHCTGEIVLTHDTPSSVYLDGQMHLLSLVAQMWCMYALQYHSVLMQQPV